MMKKLVALCFALSLLIPINSVHAGTCDLEIETEEGTICVEIDETELEEAPPVKQQCTDEGPIEMCNA